VKPGGGPDRPLPQVEATVSDPNDAYGRLVDRLVNAVTYDLQPTWQKQ
jgi:hypothetical protein